MKNALDLAYTAERVVAVDNRIPLRYYYRIAGNLINQARVYRKENNIIDLYVILIRFSSLVSETIPQHLDYPTYGAKEKVNYKKRLREVVDELEALEPKIQRQVGELNKRDTSQNNSQGYDNGYHISANDRCASWEWPNPKSQVYPRYHNEKVAYPCNFDLSPIKIPRFDQVGNSTLSPGNFGNVNFGVNPTRASGSCSSSTVNSSGTNTHVHAVKHSPSPVLSCVQSIPAGHNPDAHVSSFIVVDPRLGSVESFQDDLSQSTSAQHVHVSPEMMEVFLELAKSNTEKDLETCGILAGSLEQRTFYVTTLIIPKQESSSNLCYTMNEEEIYAVQDERSLFPLGWIHTHPSQTCFMSSVDLHTQYSYQIMLPEAIAIVMSPTDSSRKYGIFHLSDPGGIMILKHCQQRGFHIHEEPPDGSPIYDHCSNVLMNPNLKFDVVDIR